MTRSQTSSVSIFSLIALVLFLACSDTGPSEDTGGPSGKEEASPEATAGAPSGEAEASPRPTAEAPDESESEDLSLSGDYELQAAQAADLRQLVPSQDQGSYEGQLGDGSVIRLTLVEHDENLRVKEIGHEFYPTGMKIHRIVTKADTPFGRSTDKAVKFQFPVMLKFVMSNSVLSESGGNVNMSWYKAVVTWAVSTSSYSPSARRKSRRLLSIDVS